ncbi:hypothetical protein L3X38_012525 [Prunus dulcis]|uniref:Uncharacterized protein n=1 Tax=Prunus dulcis TaxID=3755 RepID=A0AAD4ZGQ5_PRUDU|nr:hypothetical protein L3X38_012525 [Prunus dulcis]
MIFLARLDYTYNKVCSDILQSDKVPSIENVFFMVRLKAQRQITMLGSRTKIGEPTIVFASKNTALVSSPISHLTATPAPAVTAVLSTSTPLTPMPPLGRETRAVFLEANTTASSSLFVPDPSIIICR